MISSAVKVLIGLVVFYIFAHLLDKVETIIFNDILLPTKWGQEFSMWYFESFLYIHLPLIVAGIILLVMSVIDVIKDKKAQVIWKLVLLGLIILTFTTGIVNMLINTRISYL